MCTFVYWKRRVSHSSQWPFPSPCSQPPVVPTEACRPVQANAFITALSLSCCVGRSQWQSEQQCLAPEPPPPTLSASSHTPGAPMPGGLSLHLLYKNKNVFRCPVLIPCHRPLRTIAFYSSKKAAGRLPSHLLPGIRAPVCAVQ